MNNGPYELRQLWRSEMVGYLVVEAVTNRLLGGVGHNPHRAWTFPLNTPRGLNVVQEYAFDHPFHNGIFVGQGKVIHNGKVANFWASAHDWRQPDNPIFQHIGELRYGSAPLIEARPGGFCFTYATTWRHSDGDPLLDETRTIDLYEHADGIVCDVVSQKQTAYGPIEFSANKHGSLGVRVQPQLLPVLGGQILAGHAGQIERGLADEVASGKACDFVAYENELPGSGHFGVCLSILENSASEQRHGPWFIRDYGMAMFNATMQVALSVSDGETWRAGLRVVAYDGALTLERAEQWRQL